MSIIKLASKIKETRSGLDRGNFSDEMHNANLDSAHFSINQLQRANKAEQKSVKNNAKQLRKSMRKTLLRPGSSEELAQSAQDYARIGRSVEAPITKYEGNPNLIGTPEYKSYKNIYDPITSFRINRRMKGMNDVDRQNMVDILQNSDRMKLYSRA